VSLPALALLPFLAVRFSWGLSGLFGDTGGIGEVAGVESGSLLADPLQPGLLLSLAVVAVGAAIVDTTRGAHRWVTWAVPLLGAGGIGLALGIISWSGLPPGLSWSVPVVLGATASACLLALGLAYWGGFSAASLLFTSERRSGGK
jgi:hypothetical protein